MTTVRVYQWHKAVIVRSDGVSVIRPYTRLHTWMMTSSAFYLSSWGGIAYQYDNRFSP